jgi:phage terminase large subunit-like protein
MGKRAERIIAWCEKHLYVPDGKLVGQKLVLPDFQKDDLRAIFPDDGNIRRAVISRGRKNGKTLTCAAITLVHLCGPEAKQNASLYSCAQSREQAALLFTAMMRMTRMSPTLSEVVTIKETNRVLQCRELGTTYTALSSDASTAFGLNPALVVFDELALSGRSDRLYDAMSTATASAASPLFVVISTEAADDSALLSQLIDDARSGRDPRVVLRHNSASESLDPFSIEAIKAANPAFNAGLMNTDEVLAMARDAKAMPSKEQEYRNLILNQRCEATAPFISQALWKACDGAVGDLTRCPVYGGLDLASCQDLCAFVMIGQAGGDDAWHVKPVFWLPSDNLADKARADRAPYLEWRRDGVLETTPGSAVNYEFVASYMLDAFKRYDIRQVAFDRALFPHLKPWLDKVLTPEQVATFVPYAQSFTAMTGALRDLEAGILGGKLRHGGNPLLASNAANAVVVVDPSGSRKLDKKRSSGRIDGLVALAMAISTANTIPVDPGKALNDAIIARGGLA